MKQNGTKDLNYTQRLKIEVWNNEKITKKEIASRLGICVATVYNELKRGEFIRKRKYYYYKGATHYRYEKSYSADLAEQRYRMGLTSHGRPIKLGKNYDYCSYVEKRIMRDKLSPDAVLGEIKRNNLFDLSISKTTLYRYISSGVFMNLTMKDCPFGERKKHYRKVRAKRPPRGTSIEQRPKEIFKRNVFGHWEMDCVIGSTKETLLVLTERLSRKELIFLMPNRKTASVVNCLNILERRFGKQFRKVFKSITVDNGSEFADFKAMERSIYRGKRTSVYYCHPYCSSERGTNERINRDIRRLLPKSTSFASLTADDVQKVEDWVNAYPRKIHNFASASEVFNNLVASL